MFNYCGFNLHSADSDRSDAMLFCILFHIITAWYLIESIPYDLLLASSTYAKFFEADCVESLCCSVVFLKKFSRGWRSQRVLEFSWSYKFH